ncbi:MAG: hypothetical protein IPP63_02700 [Chloracidobacterium sp.]|nr:hypothetical protein [Chloracidobacterium sp.]
MIWGEVHDGNAHFMGGVSGHAGLFSTADNVFQIAHQFLPEFSKLVSPETCGLFNAISRRVPMSIDPSDFSLRQRRSRPRA